ncbi:MAG: glycosyltransferase family 2 protein [Cellulophaga sp.]|uniref:glycosyltransferase family 2 protein n=1 Tax=Cellulophaga sp. TaxID=1972202 RepID=UPI0032676D05
MGSIKNFLPKFNLVEESKQYKYSFTIFVPVYNAEQTIYRVFDALDKQTFKDFEVVIINDASTDNSHSVIEDYLKKVDYPVRYINNNINTHKMSIMHQAIHMAEGELFLIHDADDSCLPSTLQVFYDEFNQIPTEKRGEFSGVSCCCVDQYDKLVGNEFPSSPFYSNAFECQLYHNIFGEKWGVTKTSLLKNIKIKDEIFSKGFIPESFLWLTLSSQNYKIKYINDRLRIYYVNESEDNLSSLSFSKKAFGMAVYSLMFINFFYRNHLLKKPFLFVKRTISLLKSSKYLKYNLSNYVKSIDSYLMKFVFIIFWPIRRYI